MLRSQSTLSKQFPVIPARIVYNRAGMHLVAAKINDSRAVIANGLYWAAVASDAEADFLCAVLNAPITNEFTRPFMSYGKDERDIHKHVWEVPIPLYDQTIGEHVRLAKLGAAAGEIVSKFDIDPDLHFAATRRHIRELLQETEIGKEIDALVYEIIS